MALVKHYHHHFHLTYYTSLRRHFGATVLVILIISMLVFFAMKSLTPVGIVSLEQISAQDLLLATFLTFFRIFIAYIVALVISIPLALIITSNSKVERLLLPLFDIIQSIPVLAFFPIVVLIFINAKFFEGAAIFILILDILWNLVFSMIGGLKTVPADVLLASKVFQAKGFNKLFKVTIPAILPYIITGSLLAWGQGWNIIIVAEVLHSYIPNGNSSQDLFGLGSLMVNAIASGNTNIFILTLAILIILIGVMNFFVWQKLLHLTERYKFD